MNKKRETMQSISGDSIVWSVKSFACFSNSAPLSLDRSNTALRSNNDILATRYNFYRYSFRLAVFRTTYSLCLLIKNRQILCTFRTIHFSYLLFLLAFKAGFSYSSMPSFANAFFTKKQLSENRLFPKLFNELKNSANHWRCRSLVAYCRALIK